jgi:hypothetical protein
MAFEHPGGPALDYLPCRYGTSKLLCRGPRKRLADPYVVFFGGTETYGKFIARPFPDLVEEVLGGRMVNMGAVNAGVDVYLGDPALIEAANGARVTVIQVMGAQNQTNRFYSVHPRRNDRFLRPSTLMTTVFRELDFTEYAFTRHLLSAMQATCRERYGLVVEELKLAWVSRMKALLERIESQTVLLWLSNRAPDTPPESDAPVPEADPLFVDRGMLEVLRPLVSATVEVVASPEARAAGTEGMVFSELEAPAAAELPGPRVHEETAAALIPVLARHIR